MIISFYHIYLSHLSFLFLFTYRFDNKIDHERPAGTIFFLSGKETSRKILRQLMKDDHDDAFNDSDAHNDDDDAHDEDGDDDHGGDDDYDDKFDDDDDDGDDDDDEYIRLNT